MSIRSLLFTSTFLIAFSTTVNAQFVHPGLSHKTSDLDRMKYMVASSIDPWATSYENMSSDDMASYNYTVEGDTSMTVLYRDSPKTNLSAFESDSRAAYYNAIRWYITEDSRYADKAVEIFNAWTGLTYLQYSGTRALTSCLIYQMLEAAEIIKSTYSGWSEEDINKFKAMLVYPGYSNTEVPANIETEGTWYWRAYMFDYVRAGNQELSAARACLAMGVFLDNEIMYDRALRYVMGLSHRSDDLSYASGPHTRGSVTSTTDYQISYNYTVGSDTADYGFNGVLTNYIWENGQCQESSRDQIHTMWGESLLCSIGEIAWNQGTDFWGESDSRILLGLEYNMKYSVSYVASYDDQLTEWTPTVESGEFVQKMDRTNRTMSLAMSPIYGTDETRILRGTFNTVAAWELPTAHYVGRGLKTEEEVKWTLRARDKSIELNELYEQAPDNGAYLGFGGLTFRRPDYCYGDPVSDFDDDDLPVFEMPVAPCTIEAENFDYFPVTGEDHTYSDETSGNSGSVYRTTEDVDIQTCSEGGYCVDEMASGEWLAYTLHIPSDGYYEISIRYAAESSDGTIQIDFGATDETGTINVPSTGGEDEWNDLIVKTGISLSKGVQNLKLKVGGSSNSYKINSITISNSTEDTINSNEIQDIEVYPNPVSDNLVITNASGAEIKIYSSDGKMVINGSIDSDSYSINMEDLEAGVYMLRLDIDGQEGSKTVIKK
jgi:hypothetical protein